MISGDMSIRADLGAKAGRLAPSQLNRELLLRAAGIRAGKAEGLWAVDATAGLGDDALLFAAAGCSLILFERDPVISALLRDALERAAETEGLSEIAARMTLLEEDSIAGMQHLDISPAVVLLDPMFPEKKKNSLTAKKLQLLRQLEKPCAQEAELLAAARFLQPGRIVIKRPLKGPYLAGVKPDHSIRGKTIRYDCILCRK